jgi:hypothetical protein
MGLDQLVPTIFFIIILFLVLPGFLRSITKSKQFFKNLFIWSIIVVCTVIISYLILK